ncbi:MAG: pseudouridine synthase [Candidatus Anammoxibacter sp.]
MKHKNPARCANTAQSDQKTIRLQKILAEAGFGSRRKCEELITNGKVEVNGEYITSLGTGVDPDVCKISCDGIPVKTQKKVYFLLNKPKGYICTNSDELGRPKAVDLFYNIAQRLYTVGRLDAETEGLIIVTNDGFIANKLAHPRYGISKTYMIEVQGRISTESLNLIKKGVWLAEGKLGSVEIRNVRKSNKRSSFEMILHEGKNREIRRMLAKVGHKVNLLRRISIGPIRLDPKIKVGKYKKIAKEKIYELLDK